MGKSKGGGGDFWSGLKGWKQVAVGDDLLLGAEDYGFCGLEELDGSALGGLVIPGSEPAAEQRQQLAAEERQQRQPKQKQQKQQQKQKQAAATEAKPQKAGKQQAKKRKQLEAAAAAAGEDGASAGAGEGGEDVAALKAQLASLAAENKQLKKKQKREEKSDKRAAAAEQRKQEKAARRAAAGVTAAAGAAAKAAAEAAAAVDVSAWRDLQLLHPSILDAIAALGFAAPTHVQAECLPAAVRDRRDVIGAAQTGSGKTLAFGIPIMQALVAEREAAGGSADGKRDGPLRALVLAPTRELALQVCEHLQAIGKRVGVWAVPIVGGISALKQERLLSKHPEVIVATPGRLWDLMREGHRHVTDLGRLSFLVIDEADRMVQQGHFGELESILGHVPAHQEQAQPESAVLPEPEPEDEEEEEEAGADGGEAGEEEEEEEGSDGEAAEGAEEVDEEEGSDGGGSDAEGDAAEQQQQQQQQQQAGDGKQQQARPRRMQTFVFSATLTLPANLRRRLRKGGGGASGSSDLDALMDKIPFRGKPKVVDLTSARRLAERVTEAWVECGEAERDEALYCLLAKHPGRTIVFVNAISAVRRLAAILKLLGLPAQALHAGMQQRQRLKALDRFRADGNAVLVATDVAARGLDIKDVRCVVHYQLPASMDVYVHRSGRTARAEAEGISIALVTPKESARFQALLRALKREEPPEFPLDHSLLPAVHKRVRLAVRLDELERKHSKEKAEKSWRQTHAEQCGIELSDEETDEEVAAASGRRQGKRAKRQASGKRGPEDAETAAGVRAQLAALLAEPLQPRFSSKWFTGGAAAAVMASVDPSAPVAAAGGGKRRKGGKAAAAEEAADREGAAAAPEPKTVATVSQAVALAQQRADSRSQHRAAAAAKQQRKSAGGAAAAGAGAAGAAGAGAAGAQQGQKAKKKKKEKGGGDPRAAALQAALGRHLAAKQRKRAGPGGGGGTRGLMTIHPALGRAASGPDALQALRAKLGGL